MIATTTSNSMRVNAEEDFRLISFIGFFFLVYFFGGVFLTRSARRSRRGSRVIVLSGNQENARVSPVPTKWDFREEGPRPRPSEREPRTFSICGSSTCNLVVRRFGIRRRDFLTGRAKHFDVKLDGIVHLTFDFRARAGRSGTAGNIWRVC